MNRTIRPALTGIIALIVSLGLMMGTALAAGPAGYESDTGDWTGWDGTLARTEIELASPTVNGTTAAPTGTQFQDSYTQQADAADAQAVAAATVTYLGCLSTTTGSYYGTKITKKTCVQRRSSDGHKRLKTRYTCKNASTGAGTTCHHWWSNDPKGRTPYYRMYKYDNYSKTWHISAYSDVRGPALNVVESVAYSGWACDLSARWITARQRNLGVTVHGGSYFAPFAQDSKHVWDSAASLDPLGGC